jgi:hypothetical protein
MIQLREEKSVDTRWFSFISLKVMKFIYFLQNQREEAPEMLLN